MVEDIFEKIISEQRAEQRGKTEPYDSFGEYSVIVRALAKMGTILVYWKNSKVSTVYLLVFVNGSA